jgi:hypothetical protein
MVDNKGLRPQVGRFMETFVICSPSQRNWRFLHDSRMVLRGVKDARDIDHCHQSNSTNLQERISLGAGAGKAGAPRPEIQHSHIRASEHTATKHSSTKHKYHQTSTPEVPIR